MKSKVRRVCAMSDIKSVILERHRSRNRAHPEPCETLFRTASFRRRRTDIPIVNLVTLGPRTIVLEKARSRATKEL